MKAMQSGCQDISSGNQDDPVYKKFIRRIQKRFIKNITTMGPLFTTNPNGLWETYLEAIPAETRQYHNCNTCKDFIRKYGSLVIVDDAGTTRSAVWDSRDAPVDEMESIVALSQALEGAKITGVFLSSEPVWGKHETGVWRHFALTPPPAILYRGVTKKPPEAMAEKREDCKNVVKALAEFRKDVVDRALAILQSEALYRSEKVIGPARWLHDLHADIDRAPRFRRANIIWKAVAMAPGGFCHPRASMIGTLLEDIASGMDFNQLKERFDKKMKPTEYQRPRVNPTAGNIVQAEEIVKKLGIQSSLRRRFATLDEIQAIWRQPSTRGPDEPPDGKVFSHLKSKGRVEILDSIRKSGAITWKKFERDVLPNAIRIEFYAHNGFDNYGAILTAAVDDAPPILQWDLSENRNPFSFYVYTHGSYPMQWRLSTGYVNVPAVTLKPHQWFVGDFEHYGEAVIFILENAIDLEDHGLALFPETLRSELRSIRSTIEAFSKTGTLEGRENGSACGIFIEKSKTPKPLHLKVKLTSGLYVEYLLDRWE